MRRGRCQICGRLRPLKANGGIAHHHVKSVACLGKNQLPLELSDSFLEAEARRWRLIWLDQYRLLRDLRERRVNYIDPAIEALADRAWRERDRLQRRLDRHRAWPARYERQMERYGYAMAPPAYLLDRTAAV